MADSLNDNLNKMNDYYKHIDDYELRSQSLSKVDIPFWQECIKRYKPARILELACGSGRIGIELLRNQENFQLEGLDLNENMLAAYREKLNREPDDSRQRVRLHLGDMSNYDLENKGKFDLIFVPFNSFGHLLETQQHLDAFRKAYEHLAPGGRFVIDLFLPGNHSGEASPVYLREVIEIPDERCQLLVYAAHQYNPYTQTSCLQNIYERIYESGLHERYFTQFNAHIFFPSELRLLFLVNDFEIDAIYGDYSWVPFEQGKRQIIIGQKRDTQRVDEQEGGLGEYSLRF